jgi:hypothetical protein
MHLFTRVKKINDTYGILLFLGVKVALGLKNRQVGEKWVSDDCSYLCKSLTIFIDT